MKEEYHAVLKDRNEHSEEEMFELNKKFTKDPVIIESTKTKEKEAKPFNRKVRIKFLFILEYSFETCLVQTTLINGILHTCAVNAFCSSD